MQKKVGKKCFMHYTKLICAHVMLNRRSINLALISDLKITKSTGPNSLTTKIMKQFKDIIASPLDDLVNRLFQSGIFLDIFKIPKVIPIFKSES